MACSFCATGQAGFERHMTVGEIVEQVVIAARVAKPRRLSNVVFMGMGEPLANYDATWAAVQRIHGARGLSARHITVSTVGLVPGIARLTREPPPVNQIGRGACWGRVGPYVERSVVALYFKKQNENYILHN